MTAPGEAPQRSWPKLLGALVAGNDLTAADTAWAMDQVMSGAATPSQIAGLAVGLRAKGETPEEIAGMAETMLAHAADRVRVPHRAVDIVGTGGDQSGTVNISTMAAIVTAAAGVPVVKHGARAASSSCGAADVLEALGVAVELSAAAVASCVAELGIGFCFAPAYHPALRHAGPTRRELGIPTPFNFLGPLTNPAQPAAGLVGCANLALAPVLAQVFAGRAADVLLVRGDDGLDELTTTTSSTIWLVRGGEVRQDTLHPQRLGVPLATPEQLRGGSAEVNARAVHDLLAGTPGPVRDAVLLNAAGAVAAYRGFPGELTEALSEALASVADAVDSGAAGTLLTNWVSRSKELHAAR